MLIDPSGFVGPDNSGALSLLTVAARHAVRKIQHVKTNRLSIALITLNAALQARLD